MRQSATICSGQYLIEKKKTRHIYCKLQYIFQLNNFLLIQFHSKVHGAWSINVPGNKGITTRLEDCVGEVKIEYMVKKREIFDKTYIRKGLKRKSSECQQKHL
ncbi:unnamed protein product [Orchesella dallaii]|uniref:Uncharacterized protein n=1 Tax=Orchesella dallaii TaxID=48710 RepID=A0ABP1Q5S7_9HEXA